MRAFTIAVCLLTMTFAGCLDPATPLAPDNVESGQMSDQGNASPEEVIEATPVKPLAEHLEGDSPPGPAVRAAPLITQIATARFTAPEPITLATVDEGGIAIDLVADQHGVSCVPRLTLDVMAAPPGYRVDRAEYTCSLQAANKTFTTATSSGVTETLPLMLDVPVDHFTWLVEVVRTLVNNEGEHRQSLLEHVEDILAAPLAFLALDWRSDEPICDTDNDTPEDPKGVATITWTGTALRGRPSVTVNVAGLQVLEASSPDGALVEDGALTTAIGEWGAESVALTLTIDFEVDNTYSMTSGLNRCGALVNHRDTTFIAASADAQGIAAGWSDSEGWTTGVTVYEILVALP